MCTAVHEVRSHGYINHQLHAPVGSTKSIHQNFCRTDNTSRTNQRTRRLETKHFVYQCLLISPWRAIQSVHESPMSMKPKRLSKAPFLAKNCRSSTVWRTPLRDFMRFDQSGWKRPAASNCERLSNIWSITIHSRSRKRYLSLLDQSPT